MEETPKKRGRPKLYLTKDMIYQVILSSSDATKAYINIDYAPLLELKASILIATGKTQDTLPHPISKRFVTLEENPQQESTIQGILDASLPVGTNFIRRTCEATIFGIAENQGWYYNCCPTCARKVRAVDSSFYCDSCVKDAGDFKPRYKLIVRVKDNSGATTFTLFNKEAETLVGVPVEALIPSMAEEGSLDGIPPIIKNIVGKKCTFDIKINAYNTERGYEEYTVFRLSESAADTTNTTNSELDNQAAKKQ